MHFPYLQRLVFTPPLLLCTKISFAALIFCTFPEMKELFANGFSPGRRSFGSLSAFPCCIKFLSVLATGNLMANALNKPSPWTLLYKLQIGFMCDFRILIMLCSLWLLQGMKSHSPFGLTYILVCEVGTALNLWLAIMT